MSAHLNIAAVRITDSSGRILAVRKQGTHHWMQPGGKLEPGEAPAAAALRELQEELGVTWEPGRLTPCGIWEGPAANEADTTLTAHLFSAEWNTALDGDGRVGAELAESAWLVPAEAILRSDLAPLLKERVLPSLLDPLA